VPARTNNYQKLVKVINHHFTTGDAKIIESAMLWDSESESFREIDILVQMEVHGCDIRIGIECTEVARPVDVRVLESFKEKHRKVGINKTIVVSKNGYSKAAAAYAEKNSIKTLTFNDSQAENWSEGLEALKNLSMYTRDYTLHSFSLVVKTIPVAERFKADQFIEVYDGGVWKPIYDFAGYLFTQSKIMETHFKELMENEKTSASPYVEVGVNLEEKYEFRDGDGCLLRPSEITIVMNYRSKYRRLDSSEVSYDGRSFVVAGFYDKKSLEYAHIAINRDGPLSVGKAIVSSALFDQKVR